MCSVCSVCVLCVIHVGAGWYHQYQVTIKFSSRSLEVTHFSLELKSRRIVLCELCELWAVSCINDVRRFSWLSNFQLNNLHNVCVSPEQSEDFAKYFSATIIINSAMINFSLSCEMVLVNINIYTQSVSNLSVHGRGCYSNFDLPSVSSPVRTFVLLPTTRPHDCWMLPETGLHRMPIY